MSLLLRLCLGLVLWAPALAYAAVLENPSEGNFYSGIGVISGWKCEATGRLTVRFNGGSPIPLAYLNERADTAGACGDTNNGFVSIFNWAILGDGEHTAVAYDNGVEFARSTFEVGTLGEEFVVDAIGECTVSDFPSPGETTTLEWNQATQHLELVREATQNGGVEDPGSYRDRATLVEVNRGIRYSGHIRLDGQDYFRVDLNESGELDIRTQSLDADPRGELLDADGRVLAENDRDEYDIHDRLNIRLRRHVEAGTYCIRITAGATTGATGPYDLLVSFYPRPYRFDDDHATGLHGTRVSIPSHTPGRLYPGDEDDFRFDFMGQGIVEVYTTGSTPTSGVIFSDGTAVARDNGALRPDGNFRIVTTLRAREPFATSVRVVGATKETEGDYTLRVRWQGGGGPEDYDPCEGRTLTPDTTCLIDVTNGCVDCGCWFRYAPAFDTSAESRSSPDGSHCPGYGEPGWQSGPGDDTGGPGSASDDIEDLLRETEATCGRPYLGPTEEEEHFRFHCMYAYYLQCHNFTAEHREVCDQIEAIEQRLGDGRPLCPHC